MAGLRATVAAVVLAAAVAVTAAAAATSAAAAPDSTTMREPVIGPVPAVEPVPASTVWDAADATAVGAATVELAATVHDEYASDDEEEAQATTLGATSRAPRRRNPPPTCILKVSEELRAPTYRGRPPRSPAAVLLIRRVTTARRGRGGRLGRRQTRAKAWACVKRWSRVTVGRRYRWRPRYACRYVGTPWRVCAGRWRRRRYAALCGGRLRRVRRVSPAVRVRPEGGERCDADPQPSPEV